MTPFIGRKAMCGKGLSPVPMSDEPPSFVASSVRAVPSDKVIRFHRVIFIITLPDEGGSSATRLVYQGSASDPMNR